MNSRPGWRTLLQAIECLEHLVGAGPDGEALGQVHPADRTGRVDQEFGGAGDVTALRSATLVQEIVTPDHLGVRVGQEGICEAQLLAVPAIDLRRVNADGDQADAARVKVWEPLLKTP